MDNPLLISVWFKIYAKISSSSNDAPAAVVQNGHLPDEFIDIYKWNDFKNELYLTLTGKEVWEKNLNEKFYFKQVQF